MNFGSLVGFALTARRFRIRGEGLGVGSYPEYLSAQLGGRPALFGAFTGLLVVAIAVIYAAAQLAAGGKALHVLMEWNYGPGVILGAVIVLVYCWAGGIRTSISTDVAHLGHVAGPGDSDRRLARPGRRPDRPPRCPGPDAALVAVLPEENTFGPVLVLSSSASLSRDVLPRFANSCGFMKPTGFAE